MRPRPTVPAPGPRRWIAPASLGLGALILLAAAGFVAFKVRAVTQELLDPPFYHPKSLDIVETTYRELATGDASNPGGTWEHQAVGELALWRLRRRTPSAGVVLLLHGFGDDRWGTSPALRWFPDLDASIFTYRHRDDAMRAGLPVPPVTFGALESREVVIMVHALEAAGTPRKRIVLMGRSLGASVGLLALAQLEREGQGPLGGFIWEGAPASSRDFAERLVRGPKDQLWHALFAPLIGALGSRWAARRGGYRVEDTDILLQSQGLTLETPSLCFLASQDRLAPPAIQKQVAARFRHMEIVEVPTWHLHCSNVLGSLYSGDILRATRNWIR